jgi:ABC-type glycerol-3-phosphate transport system substrate-binding protein
LQALGGSLVGADGKSTNFNNDMGKEAAQFVLDLFNKNKVSDPNVTDRYKEWNTGNGSIFWSGNWVIASSLDAPDLNFDVWKMPAVNGKRAAQASLESMMIFKQADENRMTEAGKLLTWIFSNFEPYYAQIGDISSLKSVVESTSYKDRPANKFLWPVDEAYAEGFTFAQNSNPVQNLNYYGSDLLIRNLDNVWLGTTSIEDGLSTLEKEVQSVLDQAPLVQFELI